MKNKRCHERPRLRRRGDLRALKRRLADLTRYGNDLAFVTDANQRILAANDRAAEVLGYARDELVRMTIGEIRDPATLGDLDARCREQRRTGRAVFETRYRRRDGSTFPVEVSVQVVEIEGRTLHLGTARDLTERQRAEEEKKALESQLVFADRMSSIGTLAAGVAHEINNPLAFVLGNVDYAIEELSKLDFQPPEVLRALADAREGATRVRAIVRDLKTFSRSDDGAKGPADVVEVLRSAVSLAQSEIRPRARLVLDLREVPPVATSEHRLGQVFLNLLINAAQAIPEGHADANQIRVSSRTSDDGRIVVEVADTGCGVDTSALPRIFEPFFTTKPVGVGTGLGLSICHGIVTGLGGEIRVESRPEIGSVFRVLLPPARSTPCSGRGVSKANGARGVPHGHV